MKKTIFTLMTALIVSASAIAQTPIENSNLTWELSDGTLTIAGTGDMPNYSWNGAPWYNSGREDITEIVIEEGVKSIGGYAFGDCINLTSVEIPGSVVSIEESAFVCCSKLTSIEIHEGVENIGDWAFSGCENLTEIDVAAGNSHYASADGILYNKDKTILIQCPAGKTVVANIPASVTSIGDWAFSGCKNLTEIDVAAGNSHYTSADGILYNKDKTILIKCPAGKTVVDNIPASVTSIGDEAFYGCSNLTSIEIPGSVVSIGIWAFWESGLVAVKIHEGVESIGDWAFNGCGNLTSIEIPGSVESIGIWVFYGCSNLTEIDVAAGNSHYASADGILYNKDKTILIQCPEGKTVVDNIPASVTSIGNEAFYGCSNLTSIEIPGSVVSIGDGAFYDCSNLTSLTILNLDPATITMYDVFDGVYGCNLIVPAGAKDDYEEIWAEYFDAGVFLTDIGEYAPTGITDLRAAPAAVVGYYSIMGQKLPQAPERGLYITVYSDGRSEKVIKN